MEPVLSIGVARPGLSVEAARRGLYLVASAQDCGHARAGVRFADAAAEGPAHVPMLLVLEGGDAAVAAAIDSGAEDAVAASASDAVIAARLAALVRRPPSAVRLRVGDLTIDRLAQHVTRGARELDLLPREYRLLLYLAERAGHAVPRAELLRAVWRLGFDPGTNVVAVHVSRLRAKLDRGYATPMLLTEAGYGYRLQP